ncbi:hypothetical protein E4U42_002107 [Claviceps africana]|uniref:C2H2-type domain-containing protein n=1 Tax=Claviceps africana TaxID=83212 RepID=A0A8K0NIV4_9HYPO|nr:hypothetical protein E4U42_002107 [Claviceps africana]
MAFPPQHRDPFLELPSILSPRPARCRRHHDLTLSGSPAITIPKLESRASVPPPLPPPRQLHRLETPARRERSTKELRAHGHSASPSSSSIYGSMYSLNRDRSGPKKRRGTVGSITGDEGYASYTAGERSQGSRPTEFFQPCQLPFQSAADMHGDSMKKKLDTVCTLDRSLRCVASPALNMALHLPIHSRAHVDAPAGLSVDGPIFSAVSPGSALFRHFPQPRMAREGPDMDYSPRTRTRRNNSEDASLSHRGCDFAGAEDTHVDKAVSPRRLRSEELCSTAGHKRRAASPPPSAGGHPCGLFTELRHRDLSTRASPTPRLHVMPQATSSASTMSSAAISRSNSYISTISVAPSSATTTTTTTTSYGRRSSGANSPGGISPTGSNSPYTTPASTNHSPRTSISGRSTAHGRNMSATSPRKMADMQKPSGSKVQPLYMCECCPKKPKKFDTAEELSAHEAEKQYECMFCGNRFKNKNEAERHQNSLHVRRHSWSCSALSAYDRAFHDSIDRPGEADSCGYCGDEFPRSGRGPGSGVLSGSVVPNHATEQDWDERIRHLQEVHKFRECNSSKKFYRADHFRQHLKHSHAGTSGKWTNILENACMLEEDPTPR